MNSKEMAMSDQKSPEPKKGFEEVLISGEKVLCRRIDMLKEYAEAFRTADSYRKIGTVEARQAIQREVVSTSQDGMENVAESGDWIIKNPGDKDPYVFGDKDKKVKNENGEEIRVPTSVEERQAKFSKKYEPKEGEPGVFIPKGIIKAIQVKENIVFDTSWGEKMAVKTGGWVADGGYSIAEESFNNTYQKIEGEK